LATLEVYGGSVDVGRRCPARRSEPFAKEPSVGLSRDRKSGIIGTYKTHDGDTGSPEVQVALLSERIN
jgi:hypothetical protein